MSEIEQKINEYWEKNKHRMPYVKKYGNMYEVFNGSSTIFMNKEGYRKYNEALKKIAQT